MPTRPARFQGEFNPDGSVRILQVYDEITMLDPVTDAEIGTGNFILHELGRGESEAFDALDQVGRNAADRLSQKRARLTAEKAAQAESLTRTEKPE